LLDVIRRKINYANVASTLALFTALGGTSYAAVSIGTAEIQPGAVTHSRLHRDAVTSSNVKNGSLLARDFKRGQLPAGAKGATGATGPQGTPGTASAYATVIFTASHPGFYAPATKNFTSITPGTSSDYWCLTPAAGIDANLRPAVVSPRVFTATSDVILRVAGVDGATDGPCPGHAGYLVQTDYAGSVGGGVAYVDFNIIVP